MNKQEARKIALRRASGVLQSYLDAGSLSEAYEDLPEKDHGKIEDAMTAIIAELERQLRRVK